MNISTADNLQYSIDRAAPGSEIRLAAGIYRIKLKIGTPALTIKGEGMDRTVIIWDDYALKTAPDGKEFNTFRTWTVAVTADHVTMEDLTIVNDAGHPEKKGQEVALTVYGDDFHMRNCRLSSTQDTLFLGPLPDDLIERYDGFLTDDLRQRKYCRQTFENCIIEGTVDFIFGCGETLFENCEIRSVRDERDIGYAAAPAHPLSQSEGFRFHRCRFTADEGVSPRSIYLARPWRDYGLCVFEECVIGNHICIEGYDKWNDTNRDQTARFYEKPMPEGRVPWAKKY
ncbi:MAG: pectin esterase [Solobacterium sp.]|nr:pectin esterase [Solobacterium sp.]